MTGAMYAAIAGLKTHMQNLNVIGNNIANVNTYGYKASRAVFKTQLYTTLTGGSNGTAVMGGTNPSQIGYGSAVASVDIDVSSGNYAVTGVPTDLMLDGDGFFMVGGKDLVQNFDGSIDDVGALSSLTLTRVGDFQFRADGYFGKNDGNVVYGFLCTGVVTEDMLTPQIQDPNSDDPEAMIPNPNFRKDLVGMKVGDPIFSDQLVPIRYPRIRASHYYQVSPDDESGLGYVSDPILDENGDQVMGPDAEGNLTVPQYKKREFSWEDAYDQDTGRMNANFVAEGKEIAYPQVWEGDGYLKDAGYSDSMKGSVLPQAEFTGISVDPNTGIITATNSDTQEIVTIGCIAIGHVTNPNGVTNIGNNYYKANAGCGQLSIGISGGNAAAMGISQINKSLQEIYGDGSETIDGLAIHATLTSVISNGLEMSKTDLAQEISMMILTQRGYQANTRIITVTDSMLEELVNMKR